MLLLFDMFPNTADWIKSALICSHERPIAFDVLAIGLTPSFWTKPNKFLNFLRFRPLFEY